VISLPEAVMVSELAALAMVEMNPPDSSVCPTNSGHRYVSDGTIERVFRIRLEFPEDPPETTIYVEKVTFDVLVLVTVNLSMIVLQFTAVY
jgi:hypothetical protein